MNPHVIRPVRAVPCLVARARRALSRHRRAVSPARTTRRQSIGETIMSTALEDARTANRLLVDPVHRPVVPQLHPDGARLVPRSRDRRAFPAIVPGAEAAIRPERSRSSRPSISPRFRPPSSSRPTETSSHSSRATWARSNWSRFFETAWRAPRPEPPAEKPSDQPDATTAQQTAKKDEPPLSAQTPAVSGYCPVSLVDDRKLKKGRNENTVVHEGRAYLCSNAAACERFRRQPDRYAPWSGGACPVTQLEQARSQPGDPRWGVLYARAAVPLRKRGRSTSIPGQSHPLRRAGDHRRPNLILRSPDARSDQPLKIGARVSKFRLGVVILQGSGTRELGRTVKAKVGTKGVHTFAPSQSQGRLAAPLGPNKGMTDSPSLVRIRRASRFASPGRSLFGLPTIEESFLSFQRHRSLRSSCLHASDQACVVLAR